MTEKRDVPQGTLAMMGLKTLDLPGEPVVARAARAGHKQLRTETRHRDQMAAIIALFFTVKGEDLS